MSDTHAAAPPPKIARFFESRAFKPFIIAGLMIYFLWLLVAKAPASIAAWAVHQAMPNVWLTSVSGTLWQGSAGGAQAVLSGNAIAIGEVSWSLNPWSLLLLKPCLDFETRVPGQMVSGEVCRSPVGSTTVKNLSLDAPIALINELLPMEAAGQLSIQIISGDMTPSKIKDLDARFSWQNASVNTGENWIGLGAFGGQAEEDGNGGLRASIFEISGPFAVDLIAGWTPGNDNWLFNGTIKPENGAPEQVVQGLQVIGEEVGDGAYKVQWP